MKDDDFCEHCGSTECKGECRNCPQCGKLKCNCPEETPGARLARLKTQTKETLKQEILKSLKEKLKQEDEDNLSLEKFEERLANKRGTRVVVTKPGGYTYRKRY